MEYQNSSLFNLEINADTRTYLYEVAKWSRFLAIVGFVGMALMALLCVMMMLGLSSASMGALGSVGLASIIGLFALLILSAFYIFPLLFLYRFSTHLKSGLDLNVQTDIDEAFKNLKSLLKFIGVFTMVILAFYALALVLGLLGGVMSMVG